MDWQDDNGRMPRSALGPSLDEPPDMAVSDEGRLLAVSNRLLEMFGYEGDEVIGSSIDRFLDAAFVERWMMPKPGTFRVRTKGVRKDGTLLAVDVLGSARQWGGSRFLAVRLAENAGLMRKETSVSLLEERFRTAFHFAAVGMALVTVQGKLQEVNYSFCEIVGLQMHDASETAVKSLLHPNDVSGFLDCCTRLLIGELQSCETEMRFLHAATGALVWASMSVTLVRDVEGRPVHFILQVQDVTHRKETEELLRKSDKLTVVGQLAAGVAHEVRNPLTVLKGFAQVLQATDRDNTYFDLMLSEIERIESIIREFLMLAKPQAARFYEADVNQLTADVFSLMETKAVMNGVYIQLQLSPEPSLIQCDANQIKQVLVNLMQNAIEAMTGGGRLLVKVRNGEGRVRLTIEDDGCGIPEERLSKLGEPFYSSKEKGTGLGLMISFQIIEKHRGTVQVSSVVDEGTTFDISFPASDGPL